MKYLSFLLLSLFIYSFQTSAQILSNNTNLNSHESYTIQVTEKATVVISFPFTVKDADCGNENIGAEKVAEKPNVIKIKAARQFTDTTSLHVFTNDNNIYSFKVSCSPNTLPTLTYDLVQRQDQSNTFASPDEINSLNELELKTDVKKIKNSKRFLHKSNRKFKTKLSLLGTYQHNNTIFLKFKISNRSRLAFQPGWTNLYIQDKKISRRSSVQQTSIDPIYIDNLPLIPGKSVKEWVIAISQTTIPDHKKLTFELHEKNGGRRINLTIQNKDLFKARSL